MKCHRISELTATQVDAVFRSDLFCLLTDSQLAALHYRDEQLKAQRAQVRIRRRRRWRLLAVVVAAGIAIAPFWQQVFTFIGLAFLLLIWALICFAMLACLWSVLRALIAAITGKRPVA